MESVSSGKKIVPTTSSKKRKRESKKEEPCNSSSISNQDNHFLNMDALSLSMVLDLVDLDTIFSVGQSCKLANANVRSYFRDCGPADLVQKDINYWLDHRNEGMPETDDDIVVEAIETDYFLSVKTFLAKFSFRKGSLVDFLLEAVFKDRLKLVKWILANFEIEKKSFLDNDGLYAACDSNGPNSLVIVDIVCRKFSITKDELLKRGTSPTTFPGMKYFFEHFDLTGNDCRHWRLKCLYHCCCCCKLHKVEGLKYLVERVGITAAEARLRVEYYYETPFVQMLRYNDLPFAKYFVEAFQVTAAEAREWRALSHVRSLETAKWVIDQFHLNGDDVRFNSFEAVRKAAQFNVALLKYLIVEFGITEDEVRNQAYSTAEIDDSEGPMKTVIDSILYYAFRALRNQRDFLTFEWLQTHWNIGQKDIEKIGIFEDFEVLLGFANNLDNPSEDDYASKLLYLFEKWNYVVPIDNDQSKYVAALCRSLIRQGWLRFAKSIIGSWMIADKSKMTQMVTGAARRGKFAIVKYFIDQGLYQLPSFIYLHHGDDGDQLKLPREICAKFVREADTNVEFDVGLTPNQIGEIFSFKPSFIGLYHDYDEVRLPRELCEQLVRSADEGVLVRGADQKHVVSSIFTHKHLKNVEFDFDLADNQIEVIRTELNSSVADDGCDSFESHDSDAGFSSNDFSDGEY